MPGVAWDNLKVTDFSPAHPQGEFSCITCRYADLHDPGLLRRHYKGKQYYTGIADVAHLRQHASTRRHIINMQVSLNNTISQAEHTHTAEFGCTIAP